MTSQESVPVHLFCWLRNSSIVELSGITTLVSILASLQLVDSWSVTMLVGEGFAGTESDVASSAGIRIQKFDRSPDLKDAIRLALRVPRDEFVYFTDDSELLEEETFATLMHLIDSERLEDYPGFVIFHGIDELNISTIKHQVPLRHAVTKVGAHHWSLRQYGGHNFGTIARNLHKYQRIFELLASSHPAQTRAAWQLLTTGRIHRDLFEAPAWGRPGRQAIILPVLQVLAERFASRERRPFLYAPVPPLAKVLGADSGERVYFGASPTGTGQPYLNELGRREGLNSMATTECDGA